MSIDSPRLQIFRESSPDVCQHDNALNKGNASPIYPIPLQQYRDHQPRSRGPQHPLIGSLIQSYPNIKVAVTITVAMTMSTYHDQSPWSLHSIICLMSVTHTSCSAICRVPYDETFLWSDHMFWFIHESMNAGIPQCAVWAGRCIYDAKGFGNIRGRGPLPWLLSWCTPPPDAQFWRDYHYQFWWYLELY